MSIQELKKAIKRFEEDIRFRSPEVNIKLNNKYNIPRNFSKVYQLNINKTLIYEIYKRN